MDRDAGRRTTPSPPYPYSYGMNQRLHQFVDTQIKRPSEIMPLTEKKGSTNLVEGGVTPGFGNQFMDDANWDGPNNPLTERPPTATSRRMPWERMRISPMGTRSA